MNAAGKAATAARVFRTWSSARPTLIVGWPAADTGLSAAYNSLLGTDGLDLVKVRGIDDIRLSVVEIEDSGTSHVLRTDSRLATRADDFLADLGSALKPFDVVAIAGSPPLGLEPTQWREFLESLRPSFIAIDMSGPLLREAAIGGADLIKVNVHEARSICAAELPKARLADDIHALGAASVVITDGPSEVQLRSSEVSATVQPRTLRKARLGGGDAFLGGMLAHIVDVGDGDLQSAAELGEKAAAQEISGGGQHLCEDG